MVITSNKDSQIIFEISDYGKGFSDESLKQATDEFYTEDTSRTDHHYGLGLNFSKKVVQMHGGILQIENRSESIGAKVTIHIPFSMENN